MDSSHHTRTNVSVERGIICSTSVHGIHNGDVLFSPMYTFTKVVKSFEINIVVQKKRALRFIEKFDNRCVGFFQIVFSSIVFIWHSPLTFDYPCSLMLGFAFEFYIFPNSIKVDI